MSNNASRWINHNPREFVAGDIICDRDLQTNLRLVLYTDDAAIWVTGFVHCAFTENNDEHPIYPMYFNEIDEGIWPKLTKLGNLNDYLAFIPRVQDEIKTNIESIENYRSE